MESIKTLEYQLAELLNAQWHSPTHIRTLEIDSLKYRIRISRERAHKKALDEFYKIAANPNSTHKQLLDASDRLKHWEWNMYL